MDYANARRRARARYKSRARALRHEQTDAERRLWWLLRNRNLCGVRFRRQHAVGPYILDFFCTEVALAIEVDGGSHFTPQGQARDAQREVVLRQMGIALMRFDNVQVLYDSELVLQRIADFVAQGLDVGPSP